MRNGGRKIRGEKREKERRKEKERERERGIEIFVPGWKSVNSGLCKY